MKKTLIIATAALSSFAAANAQDLIAGWDLNNFAAANSLRLSGNPFTGFVTTNTLDANYSAFDPTNGGVGIEAAAFGTAYFNGTNGSGFADPNATPGVVSAQVGDLTGNQPLAGVAFGGGNNNTSNFEGVAGTWTNSENLQVSNNFQGLVFSATPGPGGAGAFTDWSISFAGLTGTGSDYDVDVEYSLDGVNYQLVDTFTLTGNDTGFQSTVVAVAANEMFFRLNTSDAGNALPRFDNIGIIGTATVIPEPGTYATIAGVLALGFVAYRRRK